MAIYRVSPLTFRKRDSARLDLLTAMTYTMDLAPSISNSPHDWLSPLDGVGKFDFKEQDVSADAVKRFSFEYGSDGKSPLPSLPETSPSSWM